jgi:hypothetical protein
MFPLKQVPVSFSEGKLFCYLKFKHRSLGFLRNSYKITVDYETLRQW